VHVLELVAGVAHHLRDVRPDFGGPGEVEGVRGAKAICTRMNGVERTINAL